MQNFSSRWSSGLSLLSLVVFTMFSPVVASGDAVGRDAVSRTRGCSASQVQVIRALDQRVELRLVELIGQLKSLDFARVKTQFIEPEGRSYTPGDGTEARYADYRARVARVLTAMRKTSLEGVNYECTDSRTDRHCRGGEVIAYVLYGWSGRSYPNLYLCSNFFPHYELNADASTVFHELSHYAADTEDYGLDWWTAKSADLVRGANDAYHYQQFMERDLERTLKMFVWGSLWPKKP